MSLSSASLSHLTPEQNRIYFQTSSVQETFQYTPNKEGCILLFWEYLGSSSFITPFTECFISPLCNIFHTLNADLPCKRQHNPKISVLAPTPLPVFLQNNSTLHRDTNSNPRIYSAELTLPGLHHYKHSSSLARLYCPGSMSQKCTEFVLGSLMDPQCCSAVLPPLFQYRSWAEFNLKELNQMKNNPYKTRGLFSQCPWTGLVTADQISASASNKEKPNKWAGLVRWPWGASDWLNPQSPAQEICISPKTTRHLLPLRV